MSCSWHLETWLGHRSTRTPSLETQIDRDESKIQFCTDLGVPYEFDGTRLGKGGKPSHTIELIQEFIHNGNRELGLGRDCIEVTIIHTKAVSAIFLANQNHKGSKVTLLVLDKT